MNIMQQILNEQSIICVNKTYNYANLDVHYAIRPIEDDVRIKICNIRLWIQVCSFYS